MNEYEDSVEQISGEDEGYFDDSLYNITSYGIDISFRELISWYKDGILEKPNMQRRYVWTHKEASRFVDSVLLGLPVPSIFLAKAEDERRLIVDGYQRIMTMCDYINGDAFGKNGGSVDGGKPFALSMTPAINGRWAGKTYEELDIREQRKLSLASIHAIIFEQKSPKDDTGMYQIFERINTGGQILKPQEIRNCVCRGGFNVLLTELNHNDDWRYFFNPKDSRVDTRMADVELILRMLAFTHMSESSKTKDLSRICLSQYLTNFMQRNCDFALISKDICQKSMTDIFSCFRKIADGNLFRNGQERDGKIKFARRINPAILDSIFAAAYRYWKNEGLQSIDAKGFMDKYASLLMNGEYQTAISKRTTDTSSIRTRISLASNILFGLEYE